MLELELKIFSLKQKRSKIKALNAQSKEAKGGK